METQKQSSGSTKKKKKKKSIEDVIKSSNKILNELVVRFLVFF